MPELPHRIEGLGGVDVTPVTWRTTLRETTTGELAARIPGFQPDGVAWRAGVTFRPTGCVANDDPHTEPCPGGDVDLCVDDDPLDAVTFPPFVARSVVSCDHLVPGEGNPEITAMEEQATAALDADVIRKGSAVMDAWLGGVALPLLPSSGRPLAPSHAARVLIDALPGEVAYLWGQAGLASILTEARVINRPQGANSYSGPLGTRFVPLAAPGVGATGPVDPNDDPNQIAAPAGARWLYATGGPARFVLDAPAEQAPEARFDTRRNEYRIEYRRRGLIVVDTCQVFATLVCAAPNTACTDDADLAAEE